MRRHPQQTGPPARSCNKVTAVRRKPSTPMPDGISTVTVSGSLALVMSWPTANTAGLYKATAVPLLHCNEVACESAFDNCNMKQS
jgi:hypothetical protein